MDDIKNINITISSWPGTGATTLSLIMANLLKRKYLNMGNVFRYLGLKLGFSNEGVDRPEFDNYIENIIGSTVDNYVDYKLLNDSNLIVEADISAFRLGKHPKIFSVFLKADLDSRIQRTISENREDAIVTLEKRDKILQQKYIDLWRVDFFDEELINRKYNVLLDNSNMSIQNEVTQIIDAFQNYLQFKNFPDEYWIEVKQNIEKYSSLFLEKGKQNMIELLTKEGLESNARDIITEMTQIFPEDVNAYPENIKNLFFNTDLKNE
jgi:cytidylate kinase